MEYNLSTKSKPAYRSRSGKYIASDGIPRCRRIAKMVAEHVQGIL